MAFVFAERVMESSTSNGLGSFILTGARPAYRSFAEGVGVGNQTYYTIVNEADNVWEVGIGTYSVGVLARNTLIASSTGGFVNFAAGTKKVFATISSEFYANVLSVQSHSLIDHAGLTGVPLPEVFDSSAHQAVDHAAPPFNLLDATAHGLVDHKAPPLNLIGAGEHFSLSHVGLTGVNAFDLLAHAAELHTGVNGVPPAEAFTEAVHFATNHAGIEGVAPVVSDVSAQTIVVSVASNSTTIELGAEGTWTVFAHAAWRTEDLTSDSYLRIDLAIVSTILLGPGSDDGPDWYTHFGAATGKSGSITVSFDAPTGGSSSNWSPSDPRLRIVAIRTS